MVELKVIEVEVDEPVQTPHELVMGVVISPS